MNQRYIQVAALFALTAVILGAFGAHALKESLPPAQLSSYETGIRYQFYHTFGLFILVILQKNYPKINLLPSMRLMSLGIILFSGSIYLLSCRFLLSIESWTWLGPLTPIGGLCFILAWGILLLKMNSKKVFKK